MAFLGRTDFAVARTFFFSHEAEYHCHSFFIFNFVDNEVLFHSFNVRVPVVASFFEGLYLSIIVAEVRIRFFFTVENPLRESVVSRAMIQTWL